MNSVKQILLCCLLIFSFTGCQDRKGTASILKEAEALMYISPDSALQMLETISQPEQLMGEELADYALLLTQARSRNRIIATSDSLIRISTDYYQDSNDKARKAKAFLYLGDVYMDMQNHVEAMKALKQAEDVLGDAEARTQSLVYSKLGYLNRESENYKRASFYLHKALDINKEKGYKQWGVSNLMNLLNIDLPQVQDSSVFYVEQLEEMLLSANPDLQAKSYNNIGVHYYRHNQIEQAINYFQRAIHISVSVPYRAYLNLARIYDEKGDTARADSLYQVALLSPIWATRARIYEALYNRSLHAHRYQEAAEYMKRYQLAADSFYTQRQSQEIQELQTKYDFEVLARKKTEIENRLLRITIGGSLLLFLSILAVYYFKKKYTRQLQELENLICQINELESKEKEMEDLVNTLNESLERSTVLSNEFLRVKGKWTDSEDILALGVYIRLKRDLSLYNPSSDLPLLEHWLDIVYNQFASRLTSEHRNLTVSELSVCYLHRMGYSILEISQAMHVKTDSIKRYIYRACTNMGISQSREEFGKYISKF